MREEKRNLSEKEQMHSSDTQGFLDCFEDLQDPRIDRRKPYPVSEILLVTLLSIISGAESWNDIELFGKAKQDYLRRFLSFIFRDDDSRIRKGNAPENIATIKHVALNLLQKSKKPRESIKGLRKLAAWDENRLTNIFTKIL